MMYCKGQDDEFCKESKDTVEMVSSCPIDQNEWNIKATKKSCSSRVHNCSRTLTYHCLINPWQNMTIEVCAPKTKISTGYCAEYNTRGGKVQEFHKKSCSACDDTYVSTDAYKYQECYNVVYSRQLGNKFNRTIQDKEKNSDSVSHIADIIIISAVILSCFICLSVVFFVIYKRSGWKNLKDRLNSSMVLDLRRERNDKDREAVDDEHSSHDENGRTFS